MTPDEIRRIFATPSVALQPNVSEADIATERAQRSAALAPVLAAAQQSFLADSTLIDTIAEILGDSTRDPSWRAPVGDAGLLGFFLGVLASAGERVVLRTPLKVHTLRLVGNAAADRDENRARVVDGGHMGRIVALLEDDAVLSYAIPVLYNICVDYEPAQRAASAAGLGGAVLAILTGARLAQCRAFLNLLCKLLELLVVHDEELATADAATPALLLRLAAQPDGADSADGADSDLDTEEFCLLTTVALSYLATERFQVELVRTAGVDALLTAFLDAHGKHDAAQLDAEDAAEYKTLGSTFMTVIAEIVGLPVFLERHGFGSPEVLRLRSWVDNSLVNPHVRTGACIALGNLARDDVSSAYFVHEARVHIPLIEYLARAYRDRLAAAADDAPSPSATPHLTYATLGFLKNLSIPAGNKEALGQLLLGAPAPVLPRVWGATDTQPQIQFEAVSLTRLLVAGCAANVRRLCAPLSADPDSPAHERSNLHLLITLFRRTDLEHTKMEAARTVAAVCKVFHTVDHVLPEAVTEPAEPDETGETGEPQAKETARTRFYNAHVDIPDCFAYLVTQTRFPALRSEMWFLGALLSRSTDGAQLVMRFLQPFEACRALVEAVSGRDLIEGHKLPGGESLLSDEELLAFTANPANRASGEGADTGTGTTKDATEVSIDGLGPGPEKANAAQVASMARVDRENGLVLIAEIMKNYAHFLPPFRRGVFEQLLQTGGALAVSGQATS